MIFVGFGTGANSILHLAAGPLRQERIENLRGGSGGDGRRSPFGDVGGEFNETEGGGDTGGGVEAGDGTLTSVLCRKGFRMGGLVLVNGFVSLDEQSTQASGSGRRCDACALRLCRSWVVVVSATSALLCFDCR